MGRQISLLYDLLDKRDRWAMGMLLLPMIVAAALEMVGIGLLVAAISVFLGGTAPLGGAFDRLVGIARDVEPWHFAVCVVAFFLLKNALLAAVTWLSNHVAAVSLAKFQARLLSSYLHQPYVSHLQVNSARLIQHLQVSAPQAIDAVRILLQVLLEGVLALTTVALLVAVEPLITIVGATLLIAASALYQIQAGPFFRRAGKVAYGHEVRSITLCKEALSAVRDIQLHRCQPYMVGLYAIEAMMNAKLSALINSNVAVARVYLETLVVVGIMALAMIMKLRGWTAAEAVPIAGLYGVAAMRLMPSANRILGYFSELKRRTEIVEQVHRGLLPALCTNAPPAPEQPANSVPRLSGNLILSGVRFRYPNSDKDAVHDISLTVKQGEAVGIIGPSGAGKSTLADLMLGLLAPTEGLISVGPVSISMSGDAWHRSLGYVPQHIQILDDTLRRNVAFGVADGLIDDSAVRRALALARLDEMVAELPEGIHTPLGEHGARLSGGQRQRVGVARALYRDPDFLIFDEATSALDGETEREVVEAIRSLKGLRTQIIVAHRLSTLRDCDRIILVRDGQIADSGTMADLAARHQWLSDQLRSGLLAQSDA
jgi:ATP-binding cassette subfamily C protein